MKKVLIMGDGAMGHVLAGTVEDSAGVELAAMVRLSQGESLSDVTESADAVVDFSHPDNLDMIISYCREKGCGAVIATTGFSPEQREAIAKLAEKVPVVFAANFSLGVTVMKRVLAQITPVLAEDFDMEIVEMHHNKKLDSPSGTAKMLAEAMDPGEDYDRVYGREGNRKRGKEIGIHGVRGGTVAGEHRVIFAGEDELIEFRHMALSKKIFAVGAVKAARFVSDAKAGLYDMEDVLFG